MNTEKQTFDKPYLSIIIPVYNAEKYINDCIQSILKQTYKDWELILVDDGSTDQSSKICDYYSHIDSRILSVHTPNRGQSAARNTALDIAQGEYVTFVDSDDCIEENTYLLNMSILKADPSLQIVQFPVCEGYNINGGILSAFPEKKYNSNHDIQTAFLEHLNPITASVCNKIFKRNVFEKIRFEEGHLHEDYIIMDQIVQEIDTFQITKLGLYKYNHRPLSTTHTPKVSRHIDLLNCDISRLKRRYLFNELKHLILEQYIYVIREWQNIHYQFPKANIEEESEQINCLKPSFKYLFYKSTIKEKIWYIFISVLGFKKFTNVYQRLLRKKHQTI